MIWSYFFFLLWFIYLIASSILLFTRGFLVTRDSLSVNSTCLTYSDVPCINTNTIYSNSNQYGEEMHHHSCSASEKLGNIFSNMNVAEKFCLPARARVILIIIDALRYDFTLYDAKLKKPLYFQNKMPVIQDTLQQMQENSRLYKFMADPPTTTMQRLKALTTGSLPTFIDAGANFASNEISEDNIIDQLVRYNQSIIFMGDDTWDSLYPKRFTRAYPFPSFNVKDLDTVDQGVSANLYPELNKKDWNLLIGHYLGVDHAGHRYGPNHSEMKRKLEEMNVMIRNVIESMSDDMVLYVLGDHGMTLTGDHGGETDNEVGSALFVYSKLPFVAQQNGTKTSQVNIVPTLATVLGVPIPFSNLGSIIHDAVPILNQTIPQWKFSLISFWSNIKQVIEYLRRYSEGSDIFEGKKLKQIFESFDKLKTKMNEVDGDESFNEFKFSSIELITEVRQMCEKIWVRFDSFSITRGLLLLFLSVFFVFILADGVPANYLKDLFLSSFLSCSYIASSIAVLLCLVLYQFEFIDNLLPSIFFSTGVVSQFMLAMLIVQNWDTISLNWHCKSRNNRFISCIGRLALAFSLVCLFSNSYIEEEASILRFLLTSVSIVGVISFCQNLSKEKNSSRLTQYKIVIFSIAISFLLRLSVNFWRCREEQGLCVSENLFSGNKDPTKSAWAFALASLAIFVTITKTWLIHCGSLNDYSFSVTLAKYAPTVMVVCSGGYWVLHRLPRNIKNSQDQNWRVDHLAWMVYAATFLGISSTVIRPLLIYILPRRSNLTISNEGNIIPHLFKKIKGLIEEKERDEHKKEIPVIYGLGTVYSAAYIAIGVYLTILMGLILGESEAPSAVVMFLTAAFLLLVISFLRIVEASCIDDLFEVSNISILIWVVNAHYFFFATGHQPAWSNIDWNSAFIGTSGVLSHNFVQGTLVILNTFGPYIFMGFFLPMLVITPFTLLIITPSVFSKNKDLYKDGPSQGEVLLLERSDSMFTSIFVTSCKYMTCHGIRVFATMLAATIHCRHLMVWKIFAPKFIFEGIGMFMTLISVLCGYLVLIRINAQLEKLVTKINKHCS